MHLSPPQASLAVINPKIPILASRDRQFPDLYFRAIQQMICTSRYKNMYIKSSESKSWHKRDHWLTERVWRPGLSVPDERVNSPQPNLHKVVGKSFQGAYKTNLSCSINDQLAFSAAFPWPSCYNTHFLCNNTKLSTTGKL